MNKKVKIKKPLISIIVAGLFLTMLALPAISTDTNSANANCTAITPVNDEPSKVIRMMMMSVGGVETTETVMSEDDYQKIEGITNDLIDYFDENVKTYWKDFKFDADERAAVGQELDAASTAIRDIVPDFPVIDFIKLLNKLFETVFPYPFIYGSVPVISVGFGKTIIPFYTYDTFIGAMIRPIFINYILGFSAALNFNKYPMRLEYADRLGAHRFTTFGFMGFYMSIADLGVDIPGGITLLIGKSPFMTRLGPDLP